MTTTPTTVEQCRALDAQDPLRAMRAQFDLPDGVIYLDGNSLGPLPRRTAERVAQAIHGEWGTGLIRSWNSAGWFEAPQRVGDKIGQLIGANAGEVVATDTTSINLYKVLSAAISIAKNDHPTRSTVVSERSNFPTDLYIAESLCRQHGLTLQLIEPEELAGLLASPAAQNIAVLMLTHVNYRTGAMHDMASVTAAAHAAGALMVWDLAHSAGAVPVDLNAANTDFAVGCGYKYLNGGPGAPAFAWVNPRLAERFWQPLSGWWGHAAPFQFTPDYQPAPGIARYLCGTQPILSLTALECGLDTFLAVRDCVSDAPMQALRRKSLALTDLFIARVEARCAGHGLTLVTPRAHAQRGSQVCLAREDGAYAMIQALIARGVIGDYRAPDVLRFGFTPLYLSYEDVWNAAEHLAQVLESAEWKKPEFNRQHAVT